LTFRLPWALLALMLLVPLCLAHLRRPRRIEVASTLLWRELGATVLSRSRRVARPAGVAILLLQAAGVILMVGTLAEPAARVHDGTLPQATALRDTVPQDMGPQDMGKPASGPGATPGGPGFRRVTVTVVASGAATGALTRAFTATPGVIVRVLDPRRYQMAASRRAAAGDLVAQPDGDLLVLDRWLPPGGIPPAVPAALLIDPPAPPGSARAAGPLRDPVLSGLDETSPLLDGVDLTSLSVPVTATTRISGPPWLAPVAWTPSGPLLAAGMAGGGGVAGSGVRRLAVLALDPVQTNLPELPAFPILMQNILRWAVVTAPGSLPSPGTGTRAMPLEPVSPMPSVAFWWHWSAAGALLALAAEAAYLAWLTRRKSSALIPRVVAVALLASALAVPGISRPGGGAPLVLADRSGSVTGSALAVESTWIKAIRQAAPQARVVTFGGRTDTDMAAAIRFGTTLIGGTGSDGGPGSASRVVLLSDGLATSGGTLAAAQAAHVPVDAADVSPGTAAGPDVAVTRLAAPPAVRAGGAIALQVTLRASRISLASVTIWRDRHPVTRLAVRLAAGDNPLLVSSPSGPPGWRHFRVTVASPGDHVPGNDALDAVTRVAPTPRLLYVGTAGPVPALLRRLGFLVSVLSPSALPRQAGGYGAVAGVILDDVRNGAMVPAQLAVLVTMVRTRGLGLLVLGGPRSLTAAWYAGTPLAAALPVAGTGSGPDGSAALELILDRSGSMNDLAGSVTKISMARAAALGAIAFARSHHDRLGVISFDATPRVLVPMTTMTAAAATAAAQAVTGLSASGGTDIYDALRAAAGQLAAKGGGAGARQIILMTDGVSQSASYRTLALRMHASGITLTTVGLGGQVDQALLRQLAAVGGGRYYYTNDAAALPRIFAAEERRTVHPDHVTGRIPAEITASVPAVRTLIGTRLPDVAGLDATALKPLATADVTTSAITAAGIAGTRRLPLLAQWQYGLGRVAAWTPGMTAAWAGDWPARTAMWNDTIRWLLPGVPVPALAPRLLDPFPARAPEVAVDPLAAAGVPVRASVLTGVVVPPRGPLTRIRLTASGPGFFTGMLPDAGPGVYRVTVSAGASSAVTELAVGYPREYLPSPAGPALLAQVAALTGGTVLTSPAGAAAWESAHNGTHEAALWWLLVLLALAAFGHGILSHPVPHRHRASGTAQRLQSEHVQAAAHRA
jgi:Mg-chelatase subunit ChlD